MFDDPNTLLERRDTDIEIRVAYLPIMDMVTLNVQRGDISMASPVPKEKALDAFYHPAIYLNPTQSEAIYGRSLDVS